MRTTPSRQQMKSWVSSPERFSVEKKDSFWQVQLDQESALKCTFNSLLGHRRFHCLPFGVMPASEVLEERNESTFGDIDGVFCIADDMILAATTLNEHDASAHKVLDQV